MKPLLWGAAFGGAGAASAALAVHDSAGEGWNVLPYAVGISSFVLGTAVRWLVGQRLARLPRRTRCGAGMGALVALLAHPLAWYLAGLEHALFGRPGSLGDAPLGVADAASASLVLSAGSLLLTGWWTVPLGAGLGALLARVERPLRRSGEPTGGGEGSAGPTLSPLRRANPMVVVGLLFGMGMVLLMVGSWLYAPLYDLPAGLDWTDTTLVFLALLALCGLLLRARERWLLLLAVSCFFVVPTALALVIGARLTLNGALDRTEPTHHTARVLDAGQVRSTTGPGAHYYRLQVESWRPGDPDPWIEVHPRLYAEVTPGSSEVGVVTKPGWLGIEWVVEAHLELPDDGASSQQRP